MRISDQESRLTPWMKQAWFRKSSRNQQKQIEFWFVLDQKENKVCLFYGHPTSDTLTNPRKTNPRQNRPYTTNPAHEKPLTRTHPGHGNPTHQFTQPNQTKHEIMKPNLT
jgi:hypothetical protein